MVHLGVPFTGPDLVEFGVEVMLVSTAIARRLSRSRAWEFFSSRLQKRRIVVLPEFAITP